MKRGFAVLPLLAVVLFGAATRAELEPSRAAADASAARAQAGAFCTHPSKPLRPEAVSLCPYAAELPDCRPFADACERALRPETKPSSLRSIAEPFARTFGFLGQVGVWVILGITALLVIVSIARALATRRRDRIAPAARARPADDDQALVPESVSREEDPERVLADANECVRRGDLDRGLYRFLHAALLALDRRGALRIARGTTHGEYARSCTDQELRAPLRELVREIDRVRFGGVAPSKEGVSLACDRATRIVARAALVTMAFVLAGCAPSTGDEDPSGSQMLRAILEKQGARVTRPKVSLAKLPLPTSRASMPVLYVDTDRVSLSDEAESHLVTWVEAGGTLVLAGSPARWPRELHVKRAASESRDVEAVETTEDESEVVHRGKLAAPAALDWPTSSETRIVLATTGDAKELAVFETRREGIVCGIASHDLFTNAGLSVPGNPEVAVTILSAFASSDFMFASPEDGFSPPTNPLSSLLNAGLGLPLAHSAFALLVLFFAVGVRMSRPQSNPPVARRAFVEHVDATGALYQRTRAARHALAEFGRFAEHRLPQRLGRGATDIVTLLAQRSGESHEECARIWALALAARDTEDQRSSGDELQTLRALSALYSKTVLG